MVSHFLELKAKPGKGAALGTAIRDHATPELIATHPGFMGEIVVVAADDPDHLTAISFWDSKANGDAFYETGFARVSAFLVELMGAKPERRDCQVVEWTIPSTKR